MRTISLKNQQDIEIWKSWDNEFFSILDLQKLSFNALFLYCAQFFFISSSFYALFKLLFATKALRQISIHTFFYFPPQRGVRVKNWSLNFPQICCLWYLEKTRSVNTVGEASKEYQLISEKGGSLCPPPHQVR